MERPSLLWNANHCIHVLPLILLLQVLLLHPLSTSQTPHSAISPHQQPPFNSSSAGRRTLAPDVQVNYMIDVNQRGQLTCEVTLPPQTWNATLGHIYLRCPQVLTGICYVDCVPICNFDDEGNCEAPLSISNVIVSCRRKVVPKKRLLVFEYTVVMEELDRSGEWYCEYQGISAERPLILQASRRPKRLTTTTTTTIPTTSTTTEKPRPTTAARTTPPLTEYREAQVPAIIPNGRMENRDRSHETLRATLQQNPSVESQSPIFKGNASTPHHGENHYFHYEAISQLRPEIVLALIVVAVLSVLLNVALVLRCISTKVYLDSFKNGQPNHCLGRFLCLETSAALQCSGSGKLKEHQQPWLVHGPHGLFHQHQPPPPPPAFFRQYSPAQSDNTGAILPPYVRQTPATGLIGQTQLSNASSETGVSNPFSASFSGPLPIYHPSNQNGIEIASMTAGDLGNQGHYHHHQGTLLYRVKVADGAMLSGTESLDATASSSIHSGLHQHLKRPSSTLSTTIYDDLSGAANGFTSSYHTVTPVLLRLPAGEAGIILCHRADVEAETKEPQQQHKQNMDGCVYSARTLPVAPPGATREHYVL